MPKCLRCGWEIKDSDRFCGWDGEPLVKAEYDRAKVRAYVTDAEPYQGELLVRNLGQNPLILEGRPSSPIIHLQTETLVVPPGETGALTFTVEMGAQQVAAEVIWIESNEARPALRQVDLVISRLPVLRAELSPAQLPLGESAEVQVLLAYVKGGQAELRHASVSVGWAQVYLPAERIVAVGGQIALPLQILEQLPEGVHPLTLLVELAGLEDQEFPLVVKVERRAALECRGVSLRGIMPGRRRFEELTITNPLEYPVTLTEIRATGSEALRVTNLPRFPFRLEPRGSLDVAVEIRTGMAAGGELKGQVQIHWDSERVTTAPVRVQVLQPKEFPGYIGIDFGTTNSCVAVPDREDPTGRPQLVELFRTPGGSSIRVAPTVIYFPNPENLAEYVVGEEALVQALRPSTAADAVLRVKSLLGSAQPLPIHGQALKPEEVAAKILRFLIDKAEDHLGQLVTRAVVTVPADTSTRHMRAMLAACRMAGLVAVEFNQAELMDQIRDYTLDVLDEPLAGALEYIESEGADLVDDPVMIFDFGGGTLDITIVQVTCDAQTGDKDLKVLAVEGTKFGGEDITDMLARELAAQIRAEKGWTAEDLPTEVPLDFEWMTPSSRRQIEQNRTNLRTAANEIKELLTLQTTVTKLIAVQVGYQLRSERVTVTYTRTQLEALVTPKLAELLGLVDETLAFAGLAANQLNRIVLTGNSSRIPLVRQMLRQRYESWVVLASQPKECVALGAFRLGAQKTGVATGVLRPTGLHNRTTCRYGVLTTSAANPFQSVVPKGIELDGQERAYLYPDPALPEQAPLRASSPEFAIQICRTRTREGAPGKGLLKRVGTMQVRVPGASLRQPVPLFLEMRVDRYKVLSVRVRVADQILESTFDDAEGE